MEITKNAFSEWFKSSNQQIAGNAMRVQWTALLENQTPFFSEDELWAENEKLTSSSLCFALRMKPVLVFAAIEMLKQRLSNGKYVPFDIWPELMNLASYLLKNSEDKIAIRDFVALQKFEGQQLNHMIASALRCVDKMPEWQETALKWIDQVLPDEDFCVMIQRFLSEWGRLDEYSNILMVAAFDKILPQCAPSMIEALTKVPGPYRYDLSLGLLKKYFNSQPMDVVRAIAICFEKDKDVVLQQKLLDGIFNFFYKREQMLSLDVALVFVEGIRHFLIDHWADNCFKFGNFWEKFQYAPEFFVIIRSAVKSDWNLIAFDKGSQDPLAKLKTPLHMLCYLPVVNRADLCVLLLKVIASSRNETKNLACRILMENEDFFQFSEGFDDYQSQLEEILRGVYSLSYELKLLASAITNALVLGGEEVKNVALLYDFVKSKDLNVPALEERYGQKVQELLAQRSYEKEVLDYLLKH